MEKISFVIPIYNSQHTIMNLITRIEDTVTDLDEDYSFEIILVNDSSSDCSLETCKSICRQKKYVKLINFTKNFGQHSAILAGFRHAKGDYTVVMDDDLQIPPEETKKLLHKLISESYDVVYAKFEQKKHSSFRNIGSRINNLMATYLIDKPTNVSLASFFIARKVIIQEAIRYDNPFPYIGGLILRTTRNIGNELVIHNERQWGQSNYTFKKLVKLWINGFTNFSIRPLRIFTFLGILISIFSFLSILLIVIKKFLNPEIQMGWTSLMSTIIFFGGMQLIGIGFLGEYIGRIFLSLNKSPQYVIKETYNIEENRTKKYILRKSKDGKEYENTDSWLRKCSS